VSERVALLASRLGVSTWVASQSLEKDLQNRLSEASLRWGVVLSPHKVIPYLAERLDFKHGTPDDLNDVTNALDQLEVSDLYLCCGLAMGNERALKSFEQTFGAEIERAVCRIDSKDLADEVRQIMREKLFVGKEGSPPAVERYLGRGPLGRWLWVMATREALMWRRRYHRESPLLDGHFNDCLEGALKDTELEYLKREYHQEFRRAFEEAMGVLPNKDRNLLHYHFVRRLTIDQIGAIYRVHRTTAFRWLERSREELLSATKERLGTRLKISPVEVDSILRLVQSRLEVSVERVMPAV
jgi:RNA polymerase sigma-70 factor (ECF subfamily)